MKRGQGSQAIENHNLSSRRFGMPGTDLGETNAIPFNQAVDVDESFCGYLRGQCICGHHGRHYTWDKDHSGHDSQFSFMVENRVEESIPTPNPTRAKKR